MYWYVEQIPDFLLAVFYAYLIIRIKTARDRYFSTPFFFFFCSTGVCGILSVITHLTAARIIYYPQYAIFCTLSWIFNNVGAVGSTIGKAIIVMHRYLVLTSADTTEHSWSRRTSVCLLVIQFVTPLITGAPLAFVDYTYRMVDGEIVLDTLSDRDLLTMKIISGSIYAAYSIYSVVLTVLSGRAMARLSRLGPTRNLILKQQRNLFIIVIACSLSHLVKAVHQFLWALAAAFGRADLVALIWPYYPITNGLATYTAPIFLLLLSKKVWRLLLCLSTDCTDASITSTTLRERNATE